MRTSTFPLVGLPGSILSPRFHNETIVDIKLCCEFEPHGRASETWEWIWHLDLKHQSPHWKSTDGYRKCTGNGVKQRFSGKTLDEVVKEANHFLASVDWRGNVAEANEVIADS